MGNAQTRKSQNERGKAVKYGLVPLTLILIATPCLSQTTTTGKAETTGPCSPAVTGGNNQFSINCQGISDKLGTQFVSLLNQIAQRQLDPEKVMVKLDEIEKGINAIGKQVNSNAVKVTYTKGGIKRTESPGKNIVSDEATSIYMGLVDLFMKQDWVALAERSESQIKERPEWFTPYVMACIAYANRGDKSRAIELCEQAQQGMADNPGYEDLPEQVRNFLKQLKPNPKGN
jgi:hypothetical protein